MAVGSFPRVVVYTLAIIGISLPTNVSAKSVREIWIQLDGSEMAWPSTLQTSTSAIYTRNHVFEYKTKKYWKIDLPKKKKNIVLYFQYPSERIHSVTLSIPKWNEIFEDNFGGSSTKREDLEKFFGLYDIKLTAISGSYCESDALKNLITVPSGWGASTMSRLFTLEGIADPKNMNCRDREIKRKVKKHFCNSIHYLRSHKPFLTYRSRLDCV